MNYRCMTCGYVQDFAPTEKDTVLHHPWMEGRNYHECPACYQYLQRGGRKNGKIEMPDFVECGRLIEEEKVEKELAELNKDFQSLTEGDVSLMGKYEKNRIFGWTSGELIALKAKRDFEKKQQEI